MFLHPSTLQTELSYILQVYLRVW